MNNTKHSKYKYTYYQITHILQNHPHITKTRTHYQNTHTLPKHAHITKTPTHYQTTHTLPKHPHITKTSHTLPKHAHITKSPTHYQTTHTLPKHAHFLKYGLSGIKCSNLWTVYKGHSSATSMILVTLKDSRVTVVCKKDDLPRLVERISIFLHTKI